MRTVERHGHAPPEIQRVGLSYSLTHARTHTCRMHTRMHVCMHNRIHTCTHPHIHCHTLPHTATHCHTLPHTAAYCHALPPLPNAAKRRNTLHNTLQQVKVAGLGLAPIVQLLNNLPHTATHCTTHCNEKNRRALGKRHSYIDFTHCHTPQHTTQHTATGETSGARTSATHTVDCDLWQRYLARCGRRHFACK